MSRRWIAFGIGAAFCFGVGAYAWRILNTGRHALRSEPTEAHADRKFPERSTLVYVNEIPITSEDINWEYKLYTSGLADHEEQTAIPELGKKLDDFLEPLKERILSSIIERKLLYTFIKQDAGFDLTDPGRYTECLKDWQASIDEGSQFIQTAKDRERLKNRLCEKSIITQYLKERLYPKIKVGDDEVATYYENHQSDFSEPERVMIRQVVLASENEAKTVRARINHSNFAELAKTKSITPESEHGGLLGPFSRADMPHVFDIAFSMRPDEIRGIIKSTYGFHIIMLEKKLPSVKLGLAEAKPRIEAILRAKKEEEEYQKWVELALGAVSVKAPKPLW